MISNILFQKKKVNTERQIECDLARGLAALLIIICHVGLYLGDPNDLSLYVFSDIIGSEFGAPVFMTLMGLSIVYSRHHSPKSMLIRGLKLFLGGYFLSSFRTLLPLIIFGNIDVWCEFPAFFVVDILQFAGLSFILISLFKKINLSSWIILIISLFMVGIDQIFISMPTLLLHNEWPDYFINLLFPVTEWSCFPFFTWFYFPAFGLCFGELLIRCKNKDLMYGILLPISLCGVLYVYFQFYLLYPNYTNYYYGNNFYYMGIKNVLLNSLFITFSLSFCHFINKILPNFIRNFLKFLSSNLNIYYVISWIYISIIIHLISYFKFNFNIIQIIILTITLFIICILTTKEYIILKNMIKKHKD